MQYPTLVIGVLGLLLTALERLSMPTTDEPQPFSYTPLTSRTNIRLMWIERGLRDDTLSLLLEETTLVEKPYNALSYVWGDATDKVTIKVDGKPFNITKNLYGLLTELRSGVLTQGPFWADAVCINQADDEEKSIQVGMMGEIYKATKECLVWLGEADESTALAFGFIRALGDKGRIAYQELYKADPSKYVAEDNDRYMLNLMRTNFRTTEPPQIVQDIINISTEEVWNATFKLWDRPWFTRIWTVQEFILPPKLSFICGSQVAGIGYFTVFASIVLNYMQRQKLPDFFKDASRLSPQMADKAMASIGAFNIRLGGDTAGLFPIFLMANIYRGRQAYDPRDKLFALCAISRPTGFKPNYSKSLEEVYHSFAIHSIEEDGQLSTMLPYTYMTKTRGKLPSWVPDMRRPHGNGRTGFRYKGAGGPGPTAHRFSNDLHSLHIDAFLLDRIAYIRPVSRIKKDPVFVASILKDLAIDLPGVDIIRPENQSREEALYRTFAKDLRHSRLPVHMPMADGRIPSSIMASHLKASAANSTSSITTRLAPGEIGPQEDFPDEAIGMVFIATSRGFIGLAPVETARKGSVIGVVRGVEHPVLLCRHDSYYGLVDGYSYIHGIMDGELVELMEDGQHLWREIEVR